MNKYRKIGVTACILTILSLAGCGQAKVPAVVDVTSLAIAEDGTVTSYLVEVFDKEYYDISELASMAITEAAEYNTEKQVGETVPVTVNKVEALEDGSGKVVVTHKYDSTETFMDYNDSVLFLGTVQDAVEEGYELDVELKSVKDDSVLSKEELSNSEGLVIVTKEKARVYCPKKVAYISGGAAIADDGSVDTTQAEEAVVILMKK